MRSDRHKVVPATPSDSKTSTGRRERNKEAKQARIFAAAAGLFAEHGYATVTTQQIAERADVANGTLFRYASNKAELLLMVCNDDFRRNLDRGRHNVSAAETAAVSPATATAARPSASEANTTLAAQIELITRGYLASPTSKRGWHRPRLARQHPHDNKLKNTPRPN